MTNTWNEQFQLLNVWKTDTALIVSCVRYSFGFVDSAGGRPTGVNFDVTVDHELPIKCYLVNPDYAGPSTLGNRDVTCVKRETDIPEQVKLLHLSKITHFSALTI
jgi:hypothetical protein